MLLAAVAVVLTAAPGLLRLELRTDGRALVPAAAPEVRYDGEIRERFALRDPIAVVVHSANPDGVFNPETLRLVHDVTADLQRLDGVLPADVLSLETEPGFRHKPGTLRFRTLLDPLPETAAAELRDDLRRIELYDGILVSRDGTAATAVLPVIVTAVGVADEIHIFRRFLDLSRPERASNGTSGRGDSRVARVRATLEEMTPPVVRTSLTTAAAFLSFTLSPIGPVRAFGLFSAFGVLVCMAWSLTVIPACLVLIGDRHWLARGRSSGGRFAALAGVVRRRRAAILAAVAVAALAALDGARRLEVQDSWLSGFDPESGLARAIRRFDAGFLGSHLLQVVVETDAAHLDGTVDAAALGQFELELEPELAPELESDGTPALEGPMLAGAWIRLFQLDGGDPRPREWKTWIEAVRREDRRLVLTMPRRRGSAKFWLRPEAGERVGYEIRSEPLATPAVLERIRDLEGFLARRGEVGGVLGPARLLETVGFMLRPDDPDSRRLPADSGEARVRWHNYSRIRGEERSRRLVAPDFSAGLITVYLPGSNYADTRRLMAAIEDYQRQHLEPHGLRLGFAGDVAVSQAMIRAVVSSQVRSLLLSLAVIFAVASLFGRSLRWGFFCVVPPAFAVLLNFAAMGWLGIPLGVATSMFAAMTLGVGVDFAIHLLSRRRRLRRAGHGEAQAMAGALRVTGPAIVIDAAAVGLGFGTLALSQVPANARLGGLLMAAVFGCLVATLLFVPALVALRDRKAALSSDGLGHKVEL